MTRRSIRGAPGQSRRRPPAPCHNIETAQPKDSRMTTVLKVGLMGYGFAGATFHAPVIEHCGRATVAAIATSQSERAQADYPNATIVADFDALLALDDLDCIVIATPNDTHFDLARRALEAGKHVVVDKPVTLSAARRTHARGSRRRARTAVRAVPQPALGRRFHHAARTDRKRAARAGDALRVALRPLPAEGAAALARGDVARRRLAVRSRAASDRSGADLVRRAENRVRDGPGASRSRARAGLRASAARLRRQGNRPARDGAVRARAAAIFAFTARAAAM